MRRVPPSDRIRQRITELLEKGLESEESPLGPLMRLSAELVVQEALEKETAERLGRGYYERREEDERLRGYRNGYESGRLGTAEGEITVQVPQVRDWVEEGPYSSRLMGFLQGNTDVLEKLAVEMYARGLSVRDIEDALRDATGDPLLSRSTVSKLSETLWEDYNAFCERDLSTFEVEYVFIDAVYEGLREWGCNQGVLCAWGICSNGDKVLLHMAFGSRESYENCLDLIRVHSRHGATWPASPCIGYHRRSAGVDQGCDGSVGAEPPPALPGTQDAKYLGQSAERRAGRGQTSGPGRFLCTFPGNGTRQSCRGPGRVPRHLPRGHEELQR